MGEGDARISLLQRAVEHARNTAKYNVYFGNGRDIYDERGRVVHESVFNITDGNYRCPSTQQGYSPFTTWTRGLAWVMLGFAEELECYAQMQKCEFDALGGYNEIETTLRETAQAACDFYLDNTATDGIPYWDTGAPGLANMHGWRERTSDPFNAFEPVDSSAAAIGAQGCCGLANISETTERAIRRRV
jgi:hypothetical protein